MRGMNAIDRLYFTVRDAFGDPIGEAKYPSFEAAAESFKRHCETYEADADGAWVGVVCNEGERPIKCALAQYTFSGIRSRYRSMQDNISARALAVPEVELAALKARQLEYPFDEQTQKRIDELEKRLGVFERDVKTVGDLYVGKWRVHIVPPGGRYGLNNNLVNKHSESSIEFWDMSAKKSSFPDGQFVTRYDVDSLYDTKWGHGPVDIMRSGLCLDLSNGADWSLTGDEMKQVYGWLQTRQLLPGENYLEYHAEVDVPFSFMPDNIPLPHMERPTMSGEVILHQLVNGLPCVRDVRVEQMGVYDNGVGYTFSFNSQARRGETEKALNSALYGMRYEFSCEPKTVPVEKDPLDKVIRSCEEMSKTGEKETARERGGSADRERS